MALSRLFACLGALALCTSALTIPATHLTTLNVTGIDSVPKAISLKPRLDIIKELYAWSGFVYALDACPSKADLLRDFRKMRAMGTRVVITFGYCGTGDDPAYYDKVIGAAGQADLGIMPLAWTLLVENETFEDDAIPRIEAVTEAVIRNPDPVLAVAFGDEPLYDNDAGSAYNLAQLILNMKSTFSDAGLSDMPISISELAYGWQITDDFQSLVDTLDFFMINSFPYFAFDAQDGGSETSWKDFMGDIEYYEGIAQGKPLLVTQIGWPSNRNTWSPNSPDVVVSVDSEKAFWDLLDDHCSDFFKVKNIGWMWRSFDDTIDGWGAFYSNGTEKWDVNARTSC